MNNSDFFAKCVCGHTAPSHDEHGCITCHAKGQRCDGFWSQTEYNDAVQNARVNIAQAHLDHANQTDHRRE